MTIRKKVFTSQKITLVAGNKEYRIQALVSLFGAKYVFTDGDLPEDLRDRIGREIKVLYKNVPTRAHLVQEENNSGIVYNVRFIQPAKLFLKQIERDIREAGLPSPWLRALPRLSTEAKNLPAPALAILYFEGETYFLHVKNFTLGGLLLEFSGEALVGATVGTCFELDLVTNFGDKISDVGVQVSNVTVDQGLGAEDPRRYFFGVKFLPMNSLSDVKYRSLIRDHCLGLRNGGEPVEDL